MTTETSRTKIKRYRFAAIADIHIDLENSGKNTYFTLAERNFSRALEVVRERHCAFVISAGDQVTNASGANEEWLRYRRLIERSGYDGRILEALGNHETRFAKYGGCTLGDCHKEFIRYALLKEKPIQRHEGKTYYAYLDDTFGDVFLFLSLENGVSTNEIDNFTQEQMDWAEERIATCRREGRRIFLIQHAPIYGYGAGDDTAKPAYKGSIRLTGRNGQPFEGNQRFYRLTQADKSIIWLSGHTHIDLRDNVNYSNENNKACHMLHIPALAGTTRLAYDNDGKRCLDRTFYEDASQGYLADVYEDRVIFRGINFYYNSFYPEYTYTIYR